MRARVFVMAASLSTLHAACGDQQRRLVDGGPLVVIGEGETLRLPLAEDGVVVDDAPAWVTLDDGALALAPPCDAVAGAGGTVAVEVRVRADAEVETLQVIVEGRRTGGCAPVITAWAVAADATCDDAPALELERLCVDADSLACAGAEAIAAPALLCLGVDTRDPALEVYAIATSTAPAALLGAATAPAAAFARARWGYPLAVAPAVAGLFVLEVELYDAPPMPGDEAFDGRAWAMQVGDPGDARVEVRRDGELAALPVPIRELGLVTLQLDPYVFDAPGPNTLRVHRVGDPLALRAKAMLQLRDRETGATVTCTETSTCELTGATFELSISPAFDSASAEALRLEVVTADGVVVLDATPDDPVTTDLPLLIRNAGDDRPLAAYPTSLACVNATGVDPVQLLATTPTSATLFREWPLDAGVALAEVPRRAIGVLRDAGAGAEPVIVGVFDAQPYVRELIDGVWTAALGAGTSHAPVATGVLSVGTLHPPDSTSATHVVYLGANGQLQLRCIAATTTCQDLPSQVPVGAVVAATMVDVEGARLDPGAVGDDLVLTRVDGGTPWLCRLPITWPDTVGTPSCHRMLLGEDVIAGGAFGVVARPYPGQTDQVGVRLGLPGARAVYGVGDDLRTAADGVDIDVVQPSSQPGEPTGLASDRLAHSLVVATRFGVYERLTTAPDLAARDPIRLETAADGELTAELSRDYGALLVTCARANGTRRAAWLAGGDPDDPIAEPAVVRMVNVDTVVAGPWPVPDDE